MIIDDVLIRLKTEQQELAASALRGPTARDAFEYGRMVGMYAGLERALELVLETIDEGEDDV